MTWHWGKGLCQSGVRVPSSERWACHCHSLHSRWPCYIVIRATCTQSQPKKIYPATLQPGVRGPSSESPACHPWLQALSLTWHCSTDLHWPGLVTGHMHSLTIQSVIYSSVKKTIKVLSNSHCVAHVSVIMLYDDQSHWSCSQSFVFQSFEQDHSVICYVSVIHVIMFQS